SRVSTLLCCRRSATWSMATSKVVPGSTPSLKMAWVSVRSTTMSPRPSVTSSPRSSRRSRMGASLPTRWLSNRNHFDQRRAPASSGGPSRSTTPGRSRRVILSGHDNGRVRVKLELRDITKRFPGVVANDRVSLTINPGETLGLLGENGAGKTTLMNILYGLYSADEGSVLVDDVEVDFQSPADAIAAGIGMVHQHFMLVPVFSVAENVILGVEPTGRLGRIDLKQAIAQVEEISREYGLEVNPRATVEDLPVGIQQRIEIIKVLFRDARVIVFDEPTSVLTPQEVKDFFRIVDGLKEAGKGI